MRIDRVPVRASLKFKVMAQSLWSLDEGFSLLSVDPFHGVTYLNSGCLFVEVFVGVAGVFESGRTKGRWTTGVV